jgi:hypothetical protein
MPNASVGRIVHVRIGGECRAAMIVRSWQPEVANLQVYLDGHNDDGKTIDGMTVLVPGAIGWLTSAVDEASPAGEKYTGDNKYHWPERIE